ncbi:MAG: hypothetical protein IPM83_16720 [Ignavibacteria bacterium]|nr:hypothetical protein [Ignavibacteria bacterium]
MINDLRRRNTLSAYHVGKTETPDSVHNERTTIGLRDGTTSFLASTELCVFVDRSPMDLWESRGNGRCRSRLGKEASTPTTTHHTDFVVSGRR